jgi:hypothetical protein
MALFAENILSNLLSKLRFIPTYAEIGQTAWVIRQQVYKPWRVVRGKIT